MNPHNHAVSHAGTSMSRHTIFDGIDLMFLDVKQETIQFYAKSHTKTFAINHCEEGGALSASSHLVSIYIWVQGICR